MKRFYCTICKRVKRVRVIPDSVVKYGDDVRMREGLCTWHTHSTSSNRVHLKAEFASISGFGEMKSNKKKGGNDNGKR